jgi:hypothetical protein
MSAGPQGPLASRLPLNAHGGRDFCERLCLSTVGVARVVSPAAEFSGKRAAHQRPELVSQPGFFGHFCLCFAVGQSVLV